MTSNSYYDGRRDARRRVIRTGKLHAARAGARSHENGVKRFNIVLIFIQSSVTMRGCRASSDYSRDVPFGAGVFNDSVNPRPIDHALRRRLRGAGDAGVHATGDVRNDAVNLLFPSSSIASSHSHGEGPLLVAFVPSSSSSSGIHVDASEATESRLAIRPVAANTSPGRRAARVSPSRSRCSPRSRADTGRLDPNVSNAPSPTTDDGAGDRRSRSPAELGAGLKGGVNGDDDAVAGSIEASVAVAGVSAGACSGKGNVRAVMHVP